MGFSTQAADCPGGHYCPEGTADPYANPCPVGYYLNASAGEDSQGCTPCISGYYCDEKGLAWPKICTQVSKYWIHSVVPVGVVVSFPSLPLELLTKPAPWNGLQQSAPYNCCIIIVIIIIRTMVRTLQGHYVGCVFSPYLTV